jgi:hypothetical protein
LVFERRSTQPPYLSSCEVVVGQISWASIWHTSSRAKNHKTHEVLDDWCLLLTRSSVLPMYLRMRLNLFGSGIFYISLS